MVRVLVIDDDNEFGEITRRRLNGAGHEVEFHHGPFGSLNVLRRGDFDLILLDISMPALDGTKLVHLIRETPGLWKTKILLYSSLDLAALRKIAEGLDVDGFLPKSASKPELLKKIKDVLATSR